MGDFFGKFAFQFIVKRDLPTLIFSYTPAFLVFLSLFALVNKAEWNNTQIGMQKMAINSIASPNAYT